MSGDWTMKLSVHLDEIINNAKREPSEKPPTKLTLP